MVSLFDQEKVWEIERYNIAREGWEKGRKEGREEGWQKGRKKGREEGREEGMASILKMMVGTHGIKKTAELTGYPETEVERLSSL